MKIKNFAASLAACAVAASALAVTSFAEVTNGNQTSEGKKFYQVDIDLSKYDVASIYGVSFTLGTFDLSNGVGGGVGFNSTSTSWSSTDWANADAGKTISFDEATSTVTILKTAPVFAASDEWAQAWIQEWWGPDFSVDKVTLLGSDGKSLDVEATTTTTTAAGATTTTKAAGTTTKAAAAGSSNTGDAGAGLIIAGLTLAGAAAVITKKKN